MNSIFDRPFTFDRVSRIVFTTVIIIALIYLLGLIKAALLPFLVGWLIAYLVYPIVRFFQYKMRLKSRMLAIIATFLLIAIIITLFIIMVIPSINEEINKVHHLLINYNPQNNQIAFLPEGIQKLLAEKIDFSNLASLLNKEDWSKLIEKVTASLWSFLSGSINQIVAIFSWFVVLLYIVFILLDYDKIAEGFTMLLPDKIRPFVSKLTKDVEDSMNRYFRGQTLIAGIVGVLFSIGFLIIGFPLAIPLGLFIGLLNLIPYMQLIAIIPTAILSLIQAGETGDNFWVIFLSAMAVFVVVQIIQDTILTPRIMGKVTGLNPAIILLSLSIWGTLLGVTGMIIALPLTTLIISYYQKLILKSEIEEKDENEIVPETHVNEDINNEG